MTNEGLKKKIIEILEETEYEWTEEKNGYILQIFYDKLADALIAAGIGDVGETKEKLKKINERILLGDIIACDLSAKCAEYKYRAEVAERALQIADELGELCGRKEDYVQQAEKELAEEKR